MLNEYQNTVVRINLPHFGSTYTIEFITNLALGGTVTEVKPQKRMGYMPKSRDLVITFSHYQAGMAKSFLDHIKKVFHPDYLTVTVETVNAFATEWELYEHLLQAHDWTYAFSDDHRVWCAGEAAIAKLKALRLSLSKPYEGKLKADALWEKYAR